jgi:hypothetical protein
VSSNGKIIAESRLKYLVLSQTAAREGNSKLKENSFFLRRFFTNRFYIPSQQSIGMPVKSFLGEVNERKSEKWTKWVYLDRVACGDRDHWNLGWDVVARCAIGPRGRTSHAMYEQRPPTCLGRYES